MVGHAKQSRPRLGLPIVAGRDFNDGELSRGASEPVAIVVDDALPQRLWPGEDVLGRLIEFRDPQGPEAGCHMRVVGIVSTVKHSLSSRLFQGFLYGVDAVEPAVLVAAPLILLVSSLLASYVPARRATKVDPTVALRSE